MSKHPKPKSDKPHPDPNDDRVGEQKRSITGDVRILDEIFAELTPELKLTRKAATDKQDTNDALKRRTEFAMLAVVTLYTFFAGWQSVSIQKQLTDSRKSTADVEKNFRT